LSENLRKKFENYLIYSLYCRAPSIAPNRYTRYLQKDFCSCPLLFITYFLNFLDSFHWGPVGNRWFTFQCFSSHFSVFFFYKSSFSKTLNAFFSKRVFSIWLTAFQQIYLSDSLNSSWILFKKSVSIAWSRVFFIRFIPIYLKKSEKFLRKWKISFQSRHFFNFHNFQNLLCNTIAKYCIYNQKVKNIFDFLISDKRFSLYPIEQEFFLQLYVSRTISLSNKC